MGETPTTGAVAPRIASAIPGTDKIVPIETTGLLGGKIIRSAFSIASITPGAGLAVSMPMIANECAGSAARYLIHHS